MKMRALDSFYSSATGQVPAGAEFEVGTERAKDFRKHGLAEDVMAESAEAEAAGETNAVAATEAALDAPAAAETTDADAPAETAVPRRGRKAS
ncbi:hypothetical protein ACI2KH_19985 [Roseomonas mucosa]|uniref:hypothetical protein n=1 Tax=Roseomonas mucosa TaxID=207340 RepID=UPI00384D85F7